MTGHRPTARPTDAELRALARARDMERELDVLRKAVGRSSASADADSMADRRDAYVAELTRRLAEANARAEDAARELKRLRGERERER